MHLPNDEKIIQLLAKSNANDRDSLTQLLFLVSFVQNVSQGGWPVEEVGVINKMDVVSSPAEKKGRMRFGTKRTQSCVSSRNSQRAQRNAIGQRPVPPKQLLV